MRYYQGFVLYLMVKRDILNLILLLRLFPAYSFFLSSIASHFERNTLVVTNANLARKGVEDEELPWKTQDQQIHQESNAKSLHTLVKLSFGKNRKILSKRYFCYISLDSYSRVFLSVRVFSVFFAWKWYFFRTSSKNTSFWKKKDSNTFPHTQVSISSLKTQTSSDPLLLPAFFECEKHTFSARNLWFHVCSIYWITHSVQSWQCQKYRTNKCLDTHLSYIKRLVMRRLLVHPGIFLHIPKKIHQLQSSEKQIKKNKLNH